MRVWGWRRSVDGAGVGAVGALPEAVPRDGAARDGCTSAVAAAVTDLSDMWQVAGGCVSVWMSVRQCARPVRCVAGGRAVVRTSVHQRMCMCMCMCNPLCMVEQHASASVVPRRVVKVRRAKGRRREQPVHATQHGCGDKQPRVLKRYTRYRACSDAAWAEPMRIPLECAAAGRGCASASASVDIDDVSVLAAAAAGCCYST